MFDDMKCSSFCPSFQLLDESFFNRISIILFEAIIGSGSVIDLTNLDKEVGIVKKCKIGYGEAMNLLFFTYHSKLMQSKAIPANPFYAP